MRYRDQSLALLVIGTILMIGCDSPQTIKPIDVTGTSIQTQSDAPSWTVNPPGTLSVVGIEGPNPLGDKMYQRTMAINAARVELGRLFKLKVKAVIDNSFTQKSMVSGNNTNTSSPNANQAAQFRSSSSVLGDSMTRLRRMVDETILDNYVSGAAARQFWTDKGTGELYVLVQIDEEGAIAKVLAAARAAVEQERILAEKQLIDKVLVEDLKFLDERIQKTKELPAISSPKQDGSQN